MSQGGWRSPDRLADFSLVAVAAVWGATFPLVQAAVRHTAPLPFLVLRFVFAVLLLLPIALLRRDRTRFLHPRNAAPGLCLAAGYWLQTEGLRSVGPSVSAFLTGTSVVMVPIFGTLVGQERARPRVWLAALLALGGIYALQGRLPHRWSTGESLTLLCAVAFAFQILLLGRLARRGENAFPLGGGQLLYAAAALAIACAAGGVPLGIASIPPISWFALLFTGLLATAGAFVVQTWAQRRVPPSHAAVLFASEPLFAAAVSVGFCGDRIGARGAGGAVLILLAVLLTTVASPGSRRPERVEGGDGLC